MRKVFSGLAVIEHAGKLEAVGEALKQAFESTRDRIQANWPFLIAPVLLPFIAFAIHWMLIDYLEKSIWVFFFPAVFFAGKIAGLRGGLAATVISILLVWYFLLPVQFSWSLDEPHAVWGILAFLATGYLVSDALERLRIANSRIEKSNAELTAINKELEAFSYSVSHDLRAPLRSIDGFSQVLEEDYADRLDEIGRNYTARIRRAAQHMGALIDDMLNLARVTQFELKRSDVDLSAQAREIVETLQSASPNRIVEYTIADEMVTHGDSHLLRILLTNLLSNAWKFTGGRSPARIEFGSETNDGETVYFVRDNGVGFDMTYAGKLFGAFQRLHDAREFPGSGIGLAIVQRIASKHGGRVWAQGEPGKGATFFFTLEPPVRR